MNICPDCGTAYPPGGFGGMCPRCLLEGTSIDCGSGTAPVADVAGEHIGPFELVEQIGTGGMGVVWKARQRHPIEREVALKIIKFGMDTLEVVRRFEVERSVLAMMDHPNIATVYDAGATAGGRPYFVMELVQGEPITDYCAREKLGVKERLDIFRDVCAAAGYAHQKGIIHRDIKPSNVLVDCSSGKPVVKVIDFGIAKATEQPEAGRTLFTREGQLIGTPAYMSPEQAGAAPDIDVRSDVYSLGVLLYEILAGAPPLDPARLRTAALDEIQRIVREQDPPLPSQRVDAGGSVSSHDLRGDLDWIAMKALEKDRERRYGSAAALAEDIQRFFDFEPVTATPPSATYQLRKFVRRHRVGVITAAAVLAALLAGVVATSWQAARAVRAEREASLRAEAEAASARTAQAEAEKSRRVTAFLTAMLQGVSPSVALGQDTTVLRNILDNTRERLATDLADQPEVEMELRTIIGGVYLDLADYGAAEEMARAALALGDGAPGGETLQYCKALSMLGRVVRARGKLDDAGEILQRVIEIRKRLLGPRHPEVGSAMNNYGRVLYQQRKLDAAEQNFREGLAIARETQGAESSAVGTRLHNIGSVLHARGDYAGAEAAYRQALAIRRKASAVSTGVSKSLASITSVLRSQGKLDEAEKIGIEAVEMGKRIYGANHPQVAVTMTSLAYVFVMKKDYEQSLEMHKEVLRIVSKNYGEEHPKVDSAIGNVGFSLEKLGRYEEAEVHLRDSVRRDIARYGEAGQGIMVSLINLSRLLCGTGELAEAEQLARRAVALGEGLPEGHPAWGKPIDMLGFVMLEKGDFSEAEKIYRRLYEGYLATGNRELPVARANLASALREQGKADEAEALRREGDGGGEPDGGQ